MNLFTVYPPPPDTTNYYIAGYAVFFVIMILYIAVLVSRNRNLKQEYELLKQLDQDS